MQKITIIGGGLVGAMHALFLSKQGYEVAVYEKRPDPRSEAYIGGKSINLALSDRGWKALRHVGLEHQIQEIAIPMYERIIHNLSGEPIHQAYGKEGQAIYSVPRADLNILILKEAAKNPNVTLYFNQDLLNANFKDKTLLFQDYTNKSTHSVSYEVLFGTDGAFSEVRMALQKVPGINFSQTYISHGYKEFTIPAGPSNTYLLKQEKALHIWPRKSYMLIALPNYDKSFTCTLFYPMHGEHSFESFSSVAQFEAFFKETFPDAYARMPNLRQDYLENPTSQLVYTLANPWHVGASVCLLGDAAHAVVPFYGQGMNCGFEDCTEFEAYLNTYGSLEKAIPAFGTQRVKEAAAISQLALDNFIEMRDLVADPVFLSTQKVEKFISEQYPTLWTPLYSLVTFSHTPYSEALARGIKQKKIMERVMKIPDIERIYTDSKVAQLAVELIQQEEHKMV